MAGYQEYYKLWGKWEYTSIFLIENIAVYETNNSFSLKHIPTGLSYGIQFKPNDDIDSNKVKRMVIAGLEQKFELQKYKFKEYKRRKLF